MKDHKNVPYRLLYTVSMPPKPPPAAPSTSDPTTLAVRLRSARERAGMTLRQVGASLGWSVGRLRHYEGGQTEPTVSDLHLLAATYSVTAAYLAFGTSAPLGASVDGSVRWVAGASGDPLALPARLLDGVPGPLLYVHIDAPLPCTAIYQRHVLPPASGGYAVMTTEAGPWLGWVWQRQRRWWLQVSPAAPAVSIKDDQVLGRVVVHLARMV